jgi:ABC-type transport system involved in multi-copper enzyme maturation permease subunit
MMTRILTITQTVWLEMMRRKDIYVLFILLGALLVILVSLNIFGLSGAVGYVKDIGLLIAWIFAWVLAVNISSRELPQEESRGTVFSLLAKPITRFELIVGKWLGAWSIVSAATLLFYATIAGVILAHGGSFSVVTLFQGVLLHCAALAVLSAIGLAFSTRMNHDAAATVAFVLTGSSFLVVPRIPEFMAHEVGLRADLLMFLYNLLPHFEVFDMRMRIVHGYDPINWSIFGAVVCYGVLLTALFVCLAWLGYRNKRFSRGSLAY